jgi:hypothetical protein
MYTAPVCERNEAYLWIYLSCQGKQGFLFGKTRLTVPGRKVFTKYSIAEYPPEKRAWLACGRHAVWR